VFATQIAEGEDNIVGDEGVGGHGCRMCERVTKENADHAAKPF
jgi:hypothetical protein